MLEKRTLRDNSLIAYDAEFYPAENADRLFDEIRRGVEWQQEMTRGRPFPRLTAWFADEGVDYRYSGVVHKGAGWIPVLSGIRKDVEKASGVPFNSLLLNYYRSGRDSMGFHSDDEPELGPNPAVASVSFGAERTFVLRHKKSKEKVTYSLIHGSLLLMLGQCQTHWLHAVPKTAKKVGERINLTFRHILA